MVGSAIDGEQAVDLASEIQPDVIRMDLRMPGIDGLEACTKIGAASPRIQVVIFAAYNEPVMRHQATEAHAAGTWPRDRLPARYSMLSGWRQVAVPPVRL